MSAPAGPTRDPETGRLVLDDETRNALSDELFARWRAEDPEGQGMHCFCGDDQDLVDAVMAARERMAAREDEERE